MKWVIIFFILGVLFGLAADKYAWVFVLLPVFFIGMAFFLEGPSLYATTVGLLSVATSAAGVMVGHLLIFRRQEPQEG